MVGKQQKNVVNFQPNVPLTIVLDTDPSMAKQGSSVTKSGKTRYFWTYFMNGDSVFFADRDLNAKLQGYKKGDTVTVTNVVAPGDRWGAHKVEGAGGSTYTPPAPAPSKPVDNSAITEILENTRKILAALTQPHAAPIAQNKEEAVAVAPAKVQDPLDF